MYSKERHYMIRKNPNIPLPSLTMEAKRRWEIEQFKYEVETYNCNVADKVLTEQDRKDIKETEEI